jgi:hypothetical protein
VFQGDQIIVEPPPMVFPSELDEGSTADLPYPDYITDGDAQIRYDTFAAYPPHTFKANKSMNGSLHPPPPSLSLFVSVSVSVSLSQ